MKTATRSECRRASLGVGWPGSSQQSNVSGGGVLVGAGTGDAGHRARCGGVSAVGRVVETAAALPGAVATQRSQSAAARTLASLLNLTVPPGRCTAVTHDVAVACRATSERAHRIAIRPTSSGEHSPS